MKKPKQKFSPAPGEQLAQSANEMVLQLTLEAAKMDAGEPRPSAEILQAVKHLREVCNDLLRQVRSHRRPR